MLKTLACFVLLISLGAAHAGSATVAAAATLRYALDEISPQFTKATGHSLKVAYGSSGNFYSQIKQGAPFDVFLSADMVFPQKLVDEKLAASPALPYSEGRLVLCDALTYAERFKPQAVIDIATLTGACVIALGAVRSGLFSADDALAQALQLAGDESGDACWRMPLDDAYAEGLKSRFADVANVAGRQAGRPRFLANGRSFALSRRNRTQATPACHTVCVRSPHGYRSC